MLVTLDIIKATSALTMTVSGTLAASVSFGADVFAGIGLVAAGCLWFANFIVRHTKQRVSNENALARQAELLEQIRVSLEEGTREFKELNNRITRLEQAHNDRICRGAC